MGEISQYGGVLRAAEFAFRPMPGGCSVATPVGPERGAEHIQLDVVRIPPGAIWAPDESMDEENVVVVFAGSGKGGVGGEVAAIGRASALHAPTGQGLRLAATGNEELVGYVWRTRLTGAERHGTAPRTTGTLWDDDVQLRGFTGTGEAPMPDGTRPARMNFIFWPGSGSARLCLHCGIQEPGEVFNVHTHPESDEAFIAFEGVGQIYHLDRWHDVRAGDVLFARPGVPHGAGNPYQGPDARRFVTCGGPTPFDARLYARAGLSQEVR
ncbi:MAG: cupin [Actinobacteria bacterium 13_2_20CM_2_71_6]|nr:MAG: cupin [Actinobacteria bacterium 13_2_20CM_2_71_6]